MKPLLARDARRTLDALAADRALLAFDFDGTLAPLVANRRAAAVPPRRRELLRVEDIPLCAVVNVLPREAPDKGSAIESLVRRVGDRPVLYVGDDRSDEPAFRSGVTRVAVRVGRTARSAAGRYVPGQDSFDELLRALIAARTRGDGLGDDRVDALARALRC